MNSHDNVDTIQHKSIILQLINAVLVIEIIYIHYIYIYIYIIYIYYVYIYNNQHNNVM